ncbi:hypothetical protein J3459_010485 [Metarhizium acridum]|uniref:uncharacterized protein n=1 Tax=Metarhizium acridum TaxID=92637 RepID=UPI001C6AF328|nr:hypothetical protein J3458_020023 [Metarhizium acridum]KAG8422334.1 hypothetical protein J3459_010485 [Metarhizium acridum]
MLLGQSIVGEMGRRLEGPGSELSISHRLGGIEVPPSESARTHSWIHGQQATGSRKRRHDLQTLVLGVPGGDSKAKGRTLPERHGGSWSIPLRVQVCRGHPTGRRPTQARSLLPQVWIDAPSLAGLDAFNLNTPNTTASPEPATRELVPWTLDT